MIAVRNRVRFGFQKQGVLRHEDFGTTMELYAQSDMDSMRDAQGKFLEQLMGDRIHLLTERVQ